MDQTLSQILTYLYATLQDNSKLEAEKTALQQENARLKEQLPVHEAEKLVADGST